MSKHLDILAIEPFYGGVRQQMMQTIARLSRHRWNVQKLPARRIERRLAASSKWFAEVLYRVDLDSIKLVFTSEMLNLSELYRLVPKLARKPAIVYFHDNQTPSSEQTIYGPLDTVNISNAMVASEVWFNSQFHQDLFLDRADALFSRNPDISGQSSVSEIRSKCLVMPPPVDLNRVFSNASAGSKNIIRNPRKVLMDIRDSDPAEIIEIKRRFEMRGEVFDLVTVADPNKIPKVLAASNISPREETKLFQAMRQAGVYLCSRNKVLSDELFIPAMSAGCWPVIPEAGMFIESIPPAMHLYCMHDGTLESIMTRIEDAWYTERPPGYDIELQEYISKRDAKESCRMIDELIEDIAAGNGIKS